MNTQWHALNNIPAEWIKLMERLIAVAPSAILAGGALRDLDNGRPIKDLDVFVYAGEAHDAFDHLSKEGFVIDCTFDGSYVDAAKDIDAAYCCRKEGHLDVNVVILREPHTISEAISRFDFGICQIALLGQSAVATEEYLKDKADQTITMIRADCPKGFQWSMRRFERLSEKYVGWKLVVPEEIANKIDVMEQVG